MLPTETSVLCWEAIQTLARTMQSGDAVDSESALAHGSDRRRTLDQARADAFTDLILSNATVSTTAHLMVPVRPAAASTLSQGQGAQGTRSAPSSSSPSQVTPVQADDQSPFGEVEVPGIGVIPEAVVEQICGRFETRIARVLLDTETGVMLETGATTYRPPAAMQRFVKLRDGTCRFPGCNRPASQCETDHVMPWAPRTAAQPSARLLSEPSSTHSPPTVSVSPRDSERTRRGETKAANLASLCKHHHRAKHEAGWALAMTQDGVCTWTSRTGEVLTTRPTDYRQP